MNWLEKNATKTKLVKRISEAIYGKKPVYRSGLSGSLAIALLGKSTGRSMAVSRANPALAKVRKDAIRELRAKGLKPGSKEHRAKVRKLTETYGAGLEAAAVPGETIGLGIGTVAGLARILKRSKRHKKALTKYKKRRRNINLGVGAGAGAGAAGLFATNVSSSLKGIEEALNKKTVKG